MNQLKTLHLETSSNSAPIISGARVERIRGNTIVETLYFDFANATMSANQNYSAVAKADKLSTSTKQILTLQLVVGQEQLITSTSDVAVALLYTSENNADDAAKTMYTSPYIFFTDLGITSLNNTSILEIPFQVTGADQIAGISIASNGPTVKFQNAIVYNYVEDSLDVKTLIDTCQIAQEFSSSVITKQLMETPNINVTPITFTFTTSDDSRFPGAGTSGRLPLTIHYKTLDGKDEFITFDNFSTLLSANTLPTAGSKVSFQVQLSNFSHLTAINLNAVDDDWHLNKVSATIRKLDNASETTYNVEAFIDQWITARTPVTAEFGVSDSANVQSQIISFSVTGTTSKSGNTATASAGNVLAIKAEPGESVTFTPQVTVLGTPDNKVIWTQNKNDIDYTQYDVNNGNVTFRVPTDSVGKIITFTGYCSFDPQKSVTIAIEVVKDTTTIPGSGTTDDTNDDTNDDTSDDIITKEETSVDVVITVDKGDATTMGPALPTFTSEDNGTTYPIYENPLNTEKWTFNTLTNSQDYTVSFSPASVDIAKKAGDQTVTMTCYKNNVAVYAVNFEIVSTEIRIKPVLTETNGNKTVLHDGFTSFSAVQTVFNVPTGKVGTLSFEVTSTPNGYVDRFNVTTTLGDTIPIDTVGVSSGTYINQRTINLQCRPKEGTGQNFTIPLILRAKDMP